MSPVPPEDFDRVLIDVITDQMGLYGVWHLLQRSDVLADALRAEFADDVQTRWQEEQEYAREEAE